jgi:hypothetical protein
MFLPAVRNLPRGQGREEEEEYYIVWSGARVLLRLLSVPIWLGQTRKSGRTYHGHISRWESGVFKNRSVSDDDDDLLSDLSRKDSERVYADNPGGGRL